MSESVGIFVIIAGLAISAGGLFLLTRSQRQVLGLVLMVLGFTLAGTGLLTIEDTVVEERPPVTITASPPATPGS
jgi:hypothetical protein